MQDDDGAAYIAYSSEKNRVMHVARLTDDYRGVGNQYLRTMVPAPRHPKLSKPYTAGAVQCCHTASPCGPALRDLAAGGRRHPCGMR